METRYTVQEVRGVAMGGGMFQVVDGYQGMPVGEPKYFRDDAERTAIRLNNAAKCPHCDSTDTEPCEPDINGEYCADGCRSCGKGF